MRITFYNIHALSHIHTHTHTVYQCSSLKHYYNVLILKICIKYFWKRKGAKTAIVWLRLCLWNLNDSHYCGHKYAGVILHYCYYCSLWMCSLICKRIIIILFHCSFTHSSVNSYKCTTYTPTNVHILCWIYANLTILVTPGYYVYIFLNNSHLHEHII